MPSHKGRSWLSATCLSVLHAATLMTGEALQPVMDAATLESIATQEEDALAALAN